jgi:capsule synthesis protein PGA_cap
MPPMDLLDAAAQVLRLLGLRLSIGAVVGVALLGVAAGLVAGANHSLEGSTGAPRHQGRPVSVVWGGDVTLGSFRGLPPRRGEPVLARVAPTLRRSDLAVVNYEGTFGPGGSTKCPRGVTATCIPFQAPAQNARTLRRAGVDIVNTANNHAFDYGIEGWVATRAALRRARVQATGAVAEIHVLERNGTKVAFAGFSTYPWSADMRDLDAVKSLVKGAGERADVVVVLMHAGAEGADKTHVPGGSEEAFGEHRGDSRAFAHAAIDAGADLVLGSGPHVLRGMQLYKGRLIAYSLGNLAGWHTFSRRGTLALSALLRVDLAPDGALRRGRIVSLRLVGAGVPRVDRSGASERLMRVLSRQDFGGGSPWRKGERGEFGP